MKGGAGNKQTVKTLMDYGQGHPQNRLPPLDHPMAQQAMEDQQYQVQANIGYASSGKG